MNQGKLLSRLKDKNLLWYAGAALIILGISGVAYGIWISYNGIILSDHQTDEIFALLDSLGMTTRDGMRALIGFGSFIIIVYLFVIGAGVLGLFSSGRYITKRSLFWYAVILAAVFALLASVGVIDWIFAGFSIALCAIYATGVYVKYNRDTKEIQKKKWAKGEPEPEDDKNPAG